MLHDVEAKKRLGYTDPRTIVYYGGRERLYGKDWIRRCEELFERARYQCEKVIGGEVYGRCRREAEDPHHKVKRSDCRDDRLSNLLAYCQYHHNQEHPEKNKLHWRKHDAQQEIPNSTSEGKAHAKAATQGKLR